MIEYIIKDITTVKEGEGIIFHGCNVVGGYGAGVAGAIRKKWPHAYKAFKENGVGEHLLGSAEMLLTTGFPVIVNAYTQLTCGYDGKRYADTEAIEKTLMMVGEYAEAQNKPIYMPKIGCGLGGLSWEDDVLPIVEKVSSKYPKLNIHICDLK